MKPGQLTTTTKLNQTKAVLSFAVLLLSDTIYKHVNLNSLGIHM